MKDSRISFDMVFHYEKKHVSHEGWDMTNKKY